MPQDTTAQNIPIWLLLRTIAPYRHPLRTAGRRAVAKSRSTTLCDQSDLPIRAHASVRDGMARR